MHLSTLLFKKTASAGLTRQRLPMYFYYSGPALTVPLEKILNQTYAFGV